MNNPNPVKSTFLGPDDFEVFGGLKYTGSGLQMHEVWVPGRQVITNYGMQPDSVEITVGPMGMLLITPKGRTLSRFSSGPELWRRTQ